KYRIYAVTQHVVTDWSPGHDAYAGGPPLVSNILELEILPEDAAWCAEQLQHAVETMVLSVKDTKNRTAAAKSIRFLQTPAAMEAMAARYSGVDRETDTQFLAGLIGYHDRAYAVKQMELQLAAPDFGVSRFYLFSLAVMKLQLASPELSAEDVRLADRETKKRWRHSL